MADEKYRRLACVKCSGMFEQLMSRGRPKKYCGPVCERTARGPTERARRREAYEAETNSLYRKRLAMERHKLAAREVRCGRCDSLFCPLYASKYREGGYCKPCADEMHRARVASGDNAARAKRFGVARRYFNEMLILERDGWRCQLCGVSTPKRLRGTRDGRAPEIDHIVPLSVGGAHLPENVQCACRRCNQQKRAKARGQMKLEGFAEVRPTIREGGSKVWAMSARDRAGTQISLPSKWSKGVCL